MFIYTVGLFIGYPQGNSAEGIIQESASTVKCQKQEKNQEVTVYITKTGKKYHKGNCRHLKKSKIKISLKDACNRGYTPCKACKPPNCPTQ